MNGITLASIAWSAGHQALHQEEPIARSLLERGWDWWNQTVLPDLQGQPTAELAATAIWNFYSGARFAFLQDKAAQHPLALTGAWCALFWPEFNFPSIAEAAGCVTAGELAGEIAAQHAIEQQEIVSDEAPLHNLARIAAVTQCPHSAHLTPAEQVSAFAHGFVHMYRATVRASATLVPLHLPPIR